MSARSPIPVSSWLSSCTSSTISSISWRMLSISARIWSVVTVRSSSSSGQRKRVGEREDARQRGAQLVRDAGREQSPGLAEVGLRRHVQQHGDRAAALVAGVGAQVRQIPHPLGAVERHLERVRALAVADSLQPRGQLGRRRRRDELGPFAGQRVGSHERARSVVHEHRAECGQKGGLAGGERHRELLARRGQLKLPLVLSACAGCDRRRPAQGQRRRQSAAARG